MIDEEKNTVTEQEQPQTEEALSEEQVIESQKRRIRSFVRRTGRLTAGQQLGYDRQWDKLGFALSDGEFDIPKAFGRDAYTVLEIGFGMGQSFIEMAKAAPEKITLALKFIPQVSVQHCVWPMKKALPMYVLAKMMRLKY